MTGKKWMQYSNHNKMQIYLMLIKGRTRFWSLCLYEGYTPLPAFSSCSEQIKNWGGKGGYVSLQINDHILSAI